MNLTFQVTLNPKPWKVKWEKTDVQGIDLVKPTVQDYFRFRQRHKFVESLERRRRDKFDIMKHHRDSISKDDAESIAKRMMIADRKIPRKLY